VIAVLTADLRVSIFAPVSRLDGEKDPTILRQAITLLGEHNATLAKHVVRLERELAEAKGTTPGELQRRLALLEGQLAQMQKKIFGTSSERSTTTTKDRTPAEEPKPRTGHGPTEQRELLTVPVVHDLDDADKMCPKCGGGLEEMDGQFEEHTEVDVIPCRFVLKHHRRKKYRCTCGACIETAPGPDKLIAGGRYSVGFAIHVAISKYCDHLPLERQVRMMGREGLTVTSQTLWDQIEALELIIRRVRPRLLAHVLGHAVVGADETRWRLLTSGSKTWYVWLLHVSTAVYYTIKDSRSKDVIAKLLGTFAGTLMCDGYAAYTALAKKRKGRVVLAHCWSHVRRAYVEIQDSFPGECSEIIALINELFALDATCATGPPGDNARRTIRDESSRQVIEDIVAWFWKTAPFVLPSTGLHEAIGYMVGAWKGLVLFLDDPTIPLDNNGSERAARGPVVGRKNHYGSKSLRGTQVAATFYSLVESAKLCALEPRFYLRVAVCAGLRGEEIPLPHEVAAALADGSLDPSAFDDGTEQLVAAAIAAADDVAVPAPVSP
jgi:transposase